MGCGMARRRPRELPRSGARERRLPEHRREAWLPPGDFPGPKSESAPGLRRERGSRRGPEVRFRRPPLGRSPWVSPSGSESGSQVQLPNPSPTSVGHSTRQEGGSRQERGPLPAGTSRPEAHRDVFPDGSALPSGEIAPAIRRRRFTGSRSRDNNGLSYCTDSWRSSRIAGSRPPVGAPELERIHVAMTSLGRIPIAAGPAGCFQ
jgi:hypothetical protein